jgi:hypothetical protein
MRFVLFALLLTFAACATPGPTQPAPDARVIEAAERAFAADAAERGWAEHFLAAGDPAPRETTVAAEGKAERAPLSRLAQLAQVLLLANETAFVD